MKKLLVLAAVMTLFASPALAGIDGSAHDFVNGKNAAGTSVAISGATEICVFCHTPHNATDDKLPLWNRTLPANNVYTMYNSATFDGDPNNDVPGPESLACLSCHDGTIAVDAYGSNTGSNKLGESGGYLDGSSALLSQDLTDDHPIGVTLTNNSDQLKTPVTAELFSDKVECASCHDVHDGTIGDFLITSNANSALCLDCHDK